MRRNFTLIMIGALLLALCASAQAQQTERVFRIGFLDSSTASGGRPLADLFRQELQKLGWVEGKNVAMEFRFAEQKNERLVELAAGLVALKVDLIVVAGAPSGLAAKKATTTIPIVMTNSGDPVGAGLVASLARPGGNVTGLSGLAAELITKRLEILKDTMPKLVRVGLLQPPGSSIGRELQLNELRPAAAALKLRLDEIETQLDAKGLERAIQSANQKKTGAIMTTNATSFFAVRNQLVELASKYRLPAIYFQKEFVEEGGLMSYGADLEDLYRHAAVYVDKILKGAKPADLPVQQARKFEFVVNLKAAKAIGMTVPPNVLVRADRVIR